MVNVGLKLPESPKTSQEVESVRRSRRNNMGLLTDKCIVTPCRNGWNSNLNSARRWNQTGSISTRLTYLPSSKSKLVAKGCSFETDQETVHVSVALCSPISNLPALARTSLPVGFVICWGRLDMSLLNVSFSEPKKVTLHTK